MPAATDDVTRVGAQALHLLAICNLSGQCDELPERCEALRDHVTTLSGRSDFADFITVIAIATFVTFSIFSKDRHLSFTAKSLSEDYRGLHVQLSSQLSLPSSWLQQSVDFSVADAAPARVTVTGPGSDAAERWKHCKVVHDGHRDKNQSDDSKSPSLAVDDLMAMIGLESVKTHFVSEFERISLYRSFVLQHMLHWQSWYWEN